MSRTDITLAFDRSPTRSPLADDRVRRWVLRVTAGGDLLAFKVMDPGDTVLVGREPGVGFTIADASISRRHATMRLVGERLTVTDEGSLNGTRVNGVVAAGPTRVEVGDTVEFGSVLVKVERLGDPEIQHLVRVAERIHAANRDALTGLLSRRWIDEELPSMAEACRREQRALSCAMLDVDKFKVINDTWGHPIGDEVLRVVARLVLLCVRESDVAARYGGEEVLLIYPAADLTRGVIAAERVRGRIERHPWALHGITTGVVTASFGVATREDGETVSQWLARADRALYVAKNEGRNRVVPSRGSRS